MKLVTLCFSIIFSVFISLTSSAQINSSLDIFVGLDYSYRHLNNNGSSDINQFIIDSRKNENAILNPRIGVNYNKRLSQRLVLKTGIQFVTGGYQLAKRTNLNVIIDSSGGTMTDPNQPAELQVTERFDFISIPLVARYEFKGKILQPYIEAGVSINAALQNRTVTRIDESTSHSSGPIPYDGFNLVQFASQLAVGSNYNLSSKLQLYGQVAFQYHISPLVQAPIKERLFNTGIEFGTRIRIN